MEGARGGVVSVFENPLEQEELDEMESGRDGDLIDPGSDDEDPTEPFNARLLKDAACL